MAAKLAAAWDADDARDPKAPRLPSPPPGGPATIDPIAYSKSPDGLFHARCGCSWAWVGDSETGREEVANAHRSACSWGRAEPPMAGPGSAAPQGAARGAEPRSGRPLLVLFRDEDKYVAECSCGFRAEFDDWNTRQNHAAGHVADKHGALSIDVREENDAR